MTTRWEHHWSNRLRREEPPSTAAGLRGIALRHHPNRAKGPTQPQCQGAFPAGSKRKLEFEHDWQGRRIKKVSHSAWNGSSYATVVTTKFIYDGWNLLAELDASNNVIRSYVWGSDLSGTMQGAGGVGGLLFVKESDGTPHFVAYDGNGNVMGLVKGTDGTRTATYEYDPFGQPLRATGTMALANPMRFSTKFTDNETGLLYYGYRYYNPSLGRWANRDPIEEESELGLYFFIFNNPAGSIDVNGKNAYPPSIENWPTPDIIEIPLTPPKSSSPNARWTHPSTGRFCKTPISPFKPGAGQGGARKIIPRKPSDPGSVLQLLLHYMPQATLEHWRGVGLRQCFDKWLSNPYCCSCCTIVLRYWTTPANEAIFSAGEGHLREGPCPDDTGSIGLPNSIYERIPF